MTFLPPNFTMCAEEKAGGMHVNPILVVDDNAQIVDILSQYIKKEGWPMLAAKTGEEALALFDAA